MLETGELSEGHGRAILQVSDHAQRRAIAKRALADGWSVRQTEAQARAAGEKAAPKSKKTNLSAEELEAIATVTEKLETRLDHPVRIKPRGKGLSMEIQLDTLDQALELAKRLK